MYTPTRKDNVLDLVFTNYDIQINDELKVRAPVSNSDHNVLSWDIGCTANKVYNNRT